MVVPEQWLFHHVSFIQQPLLFVEFLVICLALKSYRTPRQFQPFHPRKEALQANSWWKAAGIKDFGRAYVPGSINSLYWG